MAKVTAQGIGSFTPKETLIKGWYELMALDAKAETFGDGPLKLLIQFEVTDGPDQPDGSSPVGRRVSDFIPLAGYETMRDSGEFVKGKLLSVLNAGGVEVEADDSFDPDELINETVEGHIRPNTNPNTGETSEQIDRYRATA
jgi:hypothetical protein